MEKHKIYKINIDWKSQIFAFLFYVIMVVIVVIALIRKYPDLEQVVIYMGLAFVLIRCIGPVFYFGYKVVLDFSQGKIRDELFGIVLGKTDVNNLARIHYRFVKYYDQGNFFPGFNDPANVEILLKNGQIMRKKWFIAESAFFDLMEEVKKINPNIDMTTNNVDRGLRGARFDRSLDNRTLYKERHYKYLPIFLILGAVTIFLFVMLVNFLV